MRWLDLPAIKPFFFFHTWGPFLRMTPFLRNRWTPIRRKLCIWGLMILTMLLRTRRYKDDDFRRFNIRDTKYYSRRLSPRIVSIRLTRRWTTWELKHETSVNAVFLTWRPYWASAQTKREPEGTKMGKKGRGGGKRPLWWGQEMGGLGLPAESQLATSCCGEAGDELGPSWTTTSPLPRLPNKHTCT